MLLFEPSITVLVNGVVLLVPPTVSCRPEGAALEAQRDRAWVERSVFVSVGRRRR